MRVSLRLSRRRHQLVVDHMPLADMLARFFVQHRPPWQRGALRDDLASEGYLALTRAARTYDKKKLPYPRAYFARACLNAMYKAVKKMTRQPGIKLTLAQAEQLLPEFDMLDHIRIAIEDLPADDRVFARDRFVTGLTLQALAARHRMPLKLASKRAARLAQILGGSLEIQLPQPNAGGGCPLASTTRGNGPGSGASDAPPCRPPG